MIPSMKRMVYVKICIKSIHSTSRTGHIVSLVAPPRLLQKEWKDSKYAFKETHVHHIFKKVFKCL